MTAPLRVGVVGLGWAGQQHLAAYHAHPDTEIVALAGLEDGPRAKLARKYGIEHAVAEWKDLLKVEGLDAVSVCVPTFLHAPIAVAALKRGAHVLSEKPMALNAPEAARMVRAARKADRVLDVAFNHRQRGDIQKLKALIEEGRLGRAYYAKAWWLRRTGIPTMGSWFTRRELAGGGPLVDIGVHVLDWSLFLLGDPKVVAVSASTYDLLAANGFGAGSSGGYKGKTGAGEGDAPHSTSRTSPRSSCDWRTGAPCSSSLLGRPPPRRRRVRHHYLRHRRRRRAHRRRLRAEGRSAALHRRRRRGRRHPRARQRGRAHTAVVEQFVDKIHACDWRRYDGSGAAALARVVDACYLSAADQREVRLDS